MAFSFLPFILFLSYLLCPAISQESNSSSLKTYIVHVQQPPGAATLSSFKDKEKWYMSFLPAETASLRESRMIYSYSNVISGFAARLTEEELSHMKNKSGFTDAYLDRILPLQTTHTPSFLGLHRDAPGLWKDSNYGRGVIIGVLDTGIAANHGSFSDEGMPSPPARWKGYCEFNASDCNKKLIGAREFLTAGTNAMQTATDRMPLRGTTNDTNGHGTHTASTAAGMFVNNANVNSLANGTASGMAPYAHLAIYKVCAEDGTCAESDILAGMDAAVEDGVDLMSLSIGGSSTPFYQDSMAIGAFGAIQRGILVSCAAGNDGPDHGTLSNEAPWILTVGASTMDRLIQTTVTVLGDNYDEINGESAYQPSKFSSTPLPLIYPGILGGRRAGFCTNSSLDGIDVRGKIVVCDDGLIKRVSKGEIVKDAGGLGMIVADLLVEGFTTFSEAHVLPASHVSYSDGQRIKAYINSASAPNASITFKGAMIGTKPAPAVAYFSSRGPSQADPNILKPDIIGPGVNVLAAWPFEVGAPGTRARFNIISGTSMATPHLSGIAALLKSMHPDWSPAAIKSAIMTTASLTANDGNPITDETSNPADFFGIGAGHVNVLKASNPGLVYDIKAYDYLAYLCRGLGYTDWQVSIIARCAVRCSDVGRLAGKDLNYPSFMVSLNASNNYTVEVTRTVTNVGAPSSTYTAAQSRTSEGVKVDVKPTVLSFTKANERLRYNVTFSSSGTSGGKYFQGYLMWISSDNNTTVGSPIVVAVV